MENLILKGIAFRRGDGLIKIDEKIIIIRLQILQQFFYSHIYIFFSIVYRLSTGCVQCPNYGYRRGDCNIFAVV